MTEEIFFTRPFDESKVQDPSLIIYRAVAHMKDALIVTNGDQTDTIAEHIMEGKSGRRGLKDQGIRAGRSKLYFPYQRSIKV